MVAHNDMCGRHAPTRGKTTIDDGLNRPYTWGRRLGFGARRSGAARRELALGIEQLSSVGKVAAFLDLQEHDVTKLLEEERLAGTLIVSLKARGVSVTPNVKTSVESLVRGMAPKRDEQDSKAHLLNSGATTTIMFTDVVGSTTITDRLGDREARSMLRVHDEIVRRQTEAHGGVEVKAMGDGFMMTFASALGAVASAAAVQHELDAYNKERSVLDTGSDEAARFMLAVRIGLGVGEPVREGEDLFGMSVIEASRISAQAQGGQILTSEIVRALVAGTGEFRFDQAGTFQLKGISGDRVLYEVLWRGS